MKLISWNVNGLRACVGKGFLDYFKDADADVFCLQETKLQEGQIDLDLPGYHQYWNYAQKKGYSGTAMFTKEEPVSVRYGLGPGDRGGVFGVFRGNLLHAQLPGRAGPSGLPDGVGKCVFGVFEKAGGGEAGDLLRGPECGPQGDRSEEPQEQPEERGIYRRGAREVYGSFRSRTGRGFTPGGPTVSPPGRKTRGGASTTSVPRRV